MQDNNRCPKIKNCVIKFVTQILILSIFATLLNWGCTASKKNYSTGTPSVPQGPSVTIQEEHDLREANNFDRYTEHMITDLDLDNKEKPNFNIDLLSLDVGRTEKLVTDLKLNLEIRNRGVEGIYFYDLIFNGLNVRGVSPVKRRVVDKKIDSFYLAPNQSRKLSLNLQLLWFQSPKPQEINRPRNEIFIQTVVSKKRIKVDEFFAEADKVSNFKELPPRLKVLSLIPKKIVIKG